MFWAEISEVVVGVELGSPVSRAAAERVMR
jgi:hypothetical protein